MVKNKLLYATIAAMLMGAVFTGCSNTHNNNTTTESQSIVSLEELASSADSDLSIELDDEDKVSSWDDSSASHITLGSQISSDVHRLKYQVQQLQSLKQEHMLYQEM